MSPSALTALLCQPAFMLANAGTPSPSLAQGCDMPSWGLALHLFRLAKLDGRGTSAATPRRGKTGRKRW